MPVSLLEVLGQPDDARILMITCTGLGSMHAANTAVSDALVDGVATGAALQVPAPWARGGAVVWGAHPVGVSLTLNAEHDQVRWGPVTVAPSLLDGDGGFPRTALDLWEHADSDEVRRECRAQLERAIGWGVDVTHLDSHLTALHGRPDLFDVMLDLAVEFDLPLSLPSDQIDVGFPLRDLAAEEGVLTPDHVVRVGPGVEARDVAIAALETLAPGVTEVQVRPAADHPEHRALTPRWAAAVGDAHLVTHDWGFRAALHRAAATTMSFLELREAQRRSRSV